MVTVENRMQTVTLRHPQLRPPMPTVLRTLSSAAVLLAAGTAFPTVTGTVVLTAVGYGLFNAVLHVARCARRDGWLAEV